MCSIKSSRLYVCASIVHFIIIAIACWQVNLVHLALSKLTKWYIINSIPLLCLMLLVTYHALNYAGIIGLGLCKVHAKLQQ